VPANVLRKWIREAEDDPVIAFPGHGSMRPEQLEIERLRHELARMKAERDILKSGGPLREGLDMRFAFIEAPEDLAGIVDMRGARGLAQWPSRLASACAECVRAAARSSAPGSAQASSPAIAPMPA